MKYKTKYQSQKAISETKEELLSTAISELKAYRLFCESLKSALQEIVEVTDDPLTKSLAENAIQRHTLDQLIHTRLIFKND